MDVLEHLEEEHRKVEKMIAQLESNTASIEERRSVLAELGDSLATHMAVEEERVYPIIEEALGSDRAREAQKEHDTSRGDMATMVALVDTRDFAAAVARFKKGISHHVEEEEGELFPRLRRQAGELIAALGDAEDVEEDVKEELGSDL